MSIRSLVALYSPGLAGVVALLTAIIGAKVVLALVGLAIFATIMWGEEWL